MIFIFRKSDLNISSLQSACAELFFQLGELHCYVEKNRGAIYETGIQTLPLLWVQRTAKKNLLAEFISFLLALVFCILAYNAKINSPALLDTRPVRALFLLAYLMMVLSVLYLLTEVYNLMQTKQSIGTRVSLTKILYKIFDRLYLVNCAMHFKFFCYWFSGKYCFTPSAILPATGFF